MMTRKHFNAIHKAIKRNLVSNNGDGEDTIHLEGFLDDLIPFMKEENPRFDVETMVKGLVMGERLTKKMVKKHG